MKTLIRGLLRRAVETAVSQGALSPVEIPDPSVETPNVKAHGDFATNLAMTLAAGQKLPPRRIAEIIVARIPDPEDFLESVETAGPGFINFRVRSRVWHRVVRRVLAEKARFGENETGAGQTVQIEFVSSNPTGPLHVGHGRGAAVGDALAGILAACGCRVQREYYVNDAGNQIRTLGRSVFLRYRERFGETVDYPDDHYQGEYIREIAAEIQAEHGNLLLQSEVETAVDICARYAVNRILTGIRQDLDAFGVRFDNWFSEQSLFSAGVVGETIGALQNRGVVYVKDGALWFGTSRYGDEKDRVVIKTDGCPTYFASDIAYHIDKFHRGFDRVIDVWGADHHGYVARMEAAVEAAGISRKRFHALLVKMVNLLRGGKPVAMSTRSGEFVTLAEVTAEVGRDAARFLFLTRHYESPLDFDLEVAKKQSNDNPVYYVQYVHARITRILEKGEERGIPPSAADDLSRLDTPEDVELIKVLAAYPETVETAAALLEPHRIPFYLKELASAFHSYYNKHRVLTDDSELTAARITLMLAVRIVIRNGLTLLGVSAPAHM
jgi:arginyl-tRNA synthetase